MLEFIRRLLFPREKQVREATRRPIRRCAVCGGNLNGHFYWDIGSAEGKSEGETNLKTLVESRKWAEAKEHHQANAPGDVRVWRAIQCPTGRIAVFPVVLAYDVWTDDQADRAHALDEVEYKDLSLFVGRRWKPL